MMTSDLLCRPVGYRYVVIRNDPKYSICLDTGEICKTDTGNPIPSDEPIFILRAKDVHALYAIEAYVRKVTEKGSAVTRLTQDSAMAVFMNFLEFKEKHPSRMKTPD